MNRLSTLTLLCVLCACTGAPSSSPPRDVPLHEHVGPTLVRLAELPATISLPSTSLPVGLQAQEAFHLTSWTPVRGGLGSRMGVQWKSVVPGPTPDGRIRPQGMQLIVDGQVVPWMMGRHLERGWRLHNGQIYLAWPGSPPEADLLHPALRKSLDRMQPERAGLSPQEFVRYTVTADSTTRSGLLLPAPAHMSWRLTPQPGARFEAWPELLKHSLKDIVSDGAIVELMVNGVSVDERALSPGSPAERWAVDLSAYSGQDVELVLRSRSGDSHVADYVFVGSPLVSAASRAPRRVVVIGMDTTRRDKMGVHGYPRPITPNLDRWAHDAVIFDHAVAPAPRTRPSFRSAQTGRSPLLAIGAPTLGEVFAASGFRTAGIAANVHLNRRFGFHRGYDTWTLNLEARAAQQVDEALVWLNDVRDQDAMLFVHFMDPHLNYKPAADYAARFVRDPDPKLPKHVSRSAVYRWQRAGALDARRKQHLQDLYDAEIAGLDEQLGRLLGAIDQLPGDTVVVIHSDHGEEFWEHGAFEHNHTLYPEVVDAVLWVKAPGLTPRHVDPAVTLADIAPTLYELMGVASPEVDGVSLVPGLRGGEVAERAIGVAHLMYGRERWAVRRDGFQYILHTGSGREELYDLRADPRALDDLTLKGRNPDAWRASLGAAHDLAVGPGWRVEMALPAGETFTLQLPAPCVSAGVIDPEAFAGRRANQVWGETPPLLPDDVAAVVISEDRSTLTITSGTAGGGTLFVLFDGLTPVGGRLITTDGAWPLREGPQVGVPVVGRMDVRPGTIIEPSVGEAARIAQRAGQVGPTDAATRELLIRLGYMKDDAP